MSKERKIVLVFLIFGTTFAVLASFGSIWLVRVAVAVAVIMAFVSVVFSWREIIKINKAHQLELKAIELNFRDQADKYHAESLKMIDRFNTRSNQLRATISKLRSQLAAAQGEISAMRGNSVWLRAEVAQRQAKIDELQLELAVYESRFAEMTQDKSQEESAEILDMPRHGKIEGANRLLPTAEEIWQDGDFPTVVDLSAVAFPAVEPDQKRGHA